MNFYRLSEGRVRRVLNSPKRVEEGVAPKTIAMMQPASLKSAGARRIARPVQTILDAADGRAGTLARREETWTQEIWVMVQDAGSKRKVISAWRYPGVTKPRGVLDMMKKEYAEFAARNGMSSSRSVTKRGE